MPTPTDDDPAYCIYDEHLLPSFVAMLASVFANEAAVKPETETTAAKKKPSNKPSIFAPKDKNAAAMSSGGCVQFPARVNNLQDVDTICNT
jgi:hypothetical protein